MAEVLDMGKQWQNLWWPAPAKLNLMLRIIGKRDDGYHNLQTIFQLLTVSDWLNFKLRDDDEIRLKDNCIGVNSAENLVLQSVELLREKSGVKKGVDIQLKKILPMGAGLGGGSSDAATTLLVLNQLWGLGYTLQELAVIGASLGADVPVFVLGETAWAEGVGEKLTPLSLPEPWFVIVNPPCHIATKEVFLNNHLTRDSSAITIRDFHEGQDRNDCLEVVRKMSKEVDETYDHFSKYNKVYLTGTGSSLFSKFQTRLEAVNILNKLPDSWDKWVVQGVNKSPLHSVLNKFSNQV